MDTTQNLAGNNNATNKSAQAFKHIYFIMIAPSHPGNIGAAARALKTMGFHQLILVDVPPSVTSHPDALAMASGAAGVLKEAKVVSTLGQALSNIHLTYALSARPRYIGPPACHIREAAKQSANNIWQQNINIGLVLGTERIGLTNEQALHCNYLCHIPTNDRYSSLNVAQALQIAAWEFRYALLDGDNKGKSLLPTAIKGKKHKREKPASSQEVDNFCP